MKNEAAKRSARDLARIVLRRVRSDQAYANLALSAELKESPNLERVDRGLATELIYGVLRHQRFLDHVISQCLNREIRKTDPFVLDELRLAVYQILMLDRVPIYAAVDEAVGFLRKVKGEKVAGFANAVLRQIDGQKIEFPSDLIKKMAIQNSLPDAIALRWVEQLGFDEANVLAQEMLKPAPFTIRCNGKKVTQENLERILIKEGAEVKKGRWSPVALRIYGHPDLFGAPSYEQGLWTVQDEAAQLVAYAVDPQPKETILDACAGVGGKSMHLATMVGDEGRVISVDHNQQKLVLLKENAERLGIRCEVFEADLTDGKVLAGIEAERIVLDAPCSGLGLFRRHPEMKWRRETRSIKSLVKLQRDLIQTVLRKLRPGGTFVYSVCTTTEEEGPNQVDWTCSKFPGMELSPLLEGPVASLLNKGMVTLWPHWHDTDGFFIARLVSR
ncbi:MAG: 16S rRNA (cytosine(967)-C(5))-methyltransferase RsmB [Pseudomonadota bacterium]